MMKLQELDNMRFIIDRKLSFEEVESLKASSDSDYFDYTKGGNSIPGWIIKNNNKYYFTKDLNSNDIYTCNAFKKSPDPKYKNRTQAGKNMWKYTIYENGKAKSGSIANSILVNRYSIPKEERSWSKGNEVHHKDGNYENDDPSNLIFCTNHQEHMQYHKNNTKEIDSMNKFRRTRRDSFDYDFDQVMMAVYEGEYDGELGQFDLPRFKGTDNLIEKIWNEKYNDIEDWREIPWTKKEKDMIFESAKDEAKMLDNIALYNSRARYQSPDETKNVLKEVFGIDNKYIHDSIRKMRSHKKDAFVSAFADKRVKNWKQVLYIYLDWEGLQSYYDVIVSYLEDEEYDELREYLNNHGIYGYYYKLVDIMETGEVNIPDMDEEDYERYF